MPNVYPPSSFESAVAGFLQAYGTVSGIKADKQAAADRKRAADNADAMQQVQLKEAGYDRITMPTIQAPPSPDQSFAQSVGHTLKNYFSGGSDQPSSIIMKTHPSARDTEIAGNQTFELGRDQAHFTNERDVATIREQAANTRNQNTINAENTRATARNATDVQVAGLNHEIQARALFQGQRDKFFTDAVAAAGGDPVQAMKNVEQFQMPQARAYRATRTDYHAAAARLNAPAEELKKARAELDLQRAAQLSGTGSKLLPKDLNGAPRPPPPPAATGGKPGNIVLPANPSPRTSNATPSVMAPFASFPPQQQKTIAEAGRRVRSGQGTLEEAKRAFPADVFSAVASLRALSSEEKSQAQKDPHFRAFLHTLGYDDSEL